MWFALPLAMVRAWGLESVRVCMIAKLPLHAPRICTCLGKTSEYVELIIYWVSSDELKTQFYIRLKLIGDTKRRLASNREVGEVL